MSRTKEQLMLAVGAALMLGGCSDTGPAAPTEAMVQSPQFSFTNAPSTPNVYRTETGFVFGIPDFETGLLAWAGLPANPADAIECGGGLDFDLTPIQSAGQLQAAFNFLALSQDMHIHVYDLTTFSDTCVDTPIAAGTGRFIYTDNDLPAAGPGANSFGARLQGRLTALAGGPVLVVGESRLLNMVDGSFRFVNSHVILKPVGGE